MDGKTCEDANECQQGTCCCNHFCDNTPGAYVCRCRLGFILDANGCNCLDVDECLNDNGGCEQVPCVHDYDEDDVMTVMTMLTMTMTMLTMTMR